MPLYDYHCECGLNKESIEKFDTDVIICPECGGNMQRLISASNFHLAGHCWAKDGYGLRQDKPKKESN